MTISNRIKRQYFANDTQQPIRLAPSQPPVLKPTKRKGTPWTDREHNRFLEALELFPAGPWKRIAEHVHTRTTRQTMTHAQRYREKIARRRRIELEAHWSTTPHLYLLTDSTKPPAASRKPKSATRTKSTTRTSLATIAMTGDGTMMNAASTSCVDGTDSRIGIDDTSRTLESTEIEIEIKIEVTEDIEDIEDVQERLQLPTLESQLFSTEDAQWLVEHFGTTR